MMLFCWELNGLGTGEVFSLFLRVRNSDIFFLMRLGDLKVFDDQASETDGDM